MKLSVILILVVLVGAQKVLAANQDLTGKVVGVERQIAGVGCTDSQNYIFIKLKKSDGSTKWYWLSGTEIYSSGMTAIALSALTTGAEVFLRINDASKECGADGGRVLILQIRG